MLKWHWVKKPYHLIKAVITIDVPVQALYCLHIHTTECIRIIDTRDREASILQTLLVQRSYRTPLQKQHFSMKAMITMDVPVSAMLLLTNIKYSVHVYNRTWVAVTPYFLHKQTSNSFWEDGSLKAFLNVIYTSWLMYGKKRNTEKKHVWKERKYRKKRQEKKEQMLKRSILAICTGLLCSHLPCIINYSKHLVYFMPFTTEWVYKLYLELEITVSVDWALNNNN